MRKKAPSLAKWLVLIALVVSACTQPIPLPPVPAAAAVRDQEEACDLLREIKAEIEAVRSSDLARVDLILARALGVVVGKPSSFWCDGVPLVEFDNVRSVVHSFDVRGLTIGIAIDKASGEVVDGFVRGK